MPILLVFALTAACLPVKWPAPVVGNGRESAIRFTAAAVALSLLAAFWLRTWVVRTLVRNPSRKLEVAQGYARVRRLLFFVNLAVVVVCVLVFGWGWSVRELLGGSAEDWHGAPPFAELAVPLPYFLILAGAWLIYYDAERILHQTTVFGPVNRAFWSRTGYFLHHLRQFLLLVLLPVLLFVTQQSLARVAPETTSTTWYRVGSLALIPVLVLFLPLLIKPLLGLKPLPAGPTRDHLTALARRLQFRCSDLLLWPTHGAAANAMIVGLLPQVRYVIFTDRLLDELTPAEVDAVLGHEVGHAKHGHIWFYAVFFVLSIAVLGGLLLLVGQQLDAMGFELPPWVADWLPLVPVLLTATYLFVVFGYLSRRCERQADVYGCRAVSCANPRCSGHDATTVYPARASSLCPTGIRTFIRALTRVGEINGVAASSRARAPVSVRGLMKGFLSWLKAWQHATMPQRVAFLLSLIDEPQRERRFQRNMLVLRWGLILALVAALVALGEAVSWHEFLAAL
jgi:STE24 endopeptidase